MNYRYLVSLLIFLCACRPDADGRRSSQAGPTVRATVLTVRTTIQPGDQTHDHQIIIADGKVRSTSELDSWRLFDTKANTVTFVDEIAGTVRTEPVKEVLARRHAAMTGPLPAHFPRPQLVRTGATRPMLGVPAQQAVIQSGAYRRELWLADHPAIPRGLFAMIQATEPPTSPLAPMMRGVESGFLEVTGFPLLDHTRIEFAEEKTSITSAVVAIEQRDVPQGAIEPAATYLDLTPREEAK